MKRKSQLIARGRNGEDIIKLWLMINLKLSMIVYNPDGEIIDKPINQKDSYREILYTFLESGNVEFSKVKDNKNNLLMLINDKAILFVGKNKLSDCFIEGQPWKGRLLTKGLIALKWERLINGKKVAMEYFNRGEIK